FSLPQLGPNLSGERRLDDLLRGTDADPFTRERPAVEPDLELRNAGVAVEIEIDDTAYPLQSFDSVLERRAHLLEVRAEDLEHHLAANTAHALLDIVLDGLGEIEADAGDLGDRRAHGFDEALFVPALAPLRPRLEAHEGLAHVHALVVGPVFGSPFLAERPS